MSEIIVGTKLQSKKSELVATVVEINTKCKQAIVDLSNGTNKAYSLATLKDKREWVIMNDDTYVEEVMQQKADLGIECPPIESYEVVEENLVPMPGTQDPEWGKKHFNERDTEYLTKLTKKQQKIITKIYKGEDKLYHVTVDFNGTVTQLDDKSLSKIYLMINAIIKGEK